MTKKLFMIALTSLFSTMAFAADLYVRNGGAAGTYSTVSSVITAASDGDRIIIQPKTNGCAYVENLTINKSLTFVSETNYNRYFIQGTITINLATGRIVNISSLSSGNFTIYNVVVSGPTTGGRTTISQMTPIQIGTATNWKRTASGYSMILTEPLMFLLSHQKFTC